MAKQNFPSAIDLFGKSYRLVRQNLAVFILLNILPAIAAVTEAAVKYSDKAKEGSDWGNIFGSAFFAPDSDGTGLVASGLLTFAFVVVLIFNYLLLLIFVLRVAQGRRPTFASLLSEVTRSWLWLKLLGLMVLMAFIVLFGLLLLVVPGIIFVWRFFLTPYIYIDKRVPMSDALSESWDMTRGHGWVIYSVILFSVVLSLTGIIPLIGGVIAFVLAAIYSLAPALRYVEISKHYKPTPEKK